jgi:hypothetical protein
MLINSGDSEVGQPDKLPFKLNLPTEDAKVEALVLILRHLKGLTSAIEKCIVKDENNAKT